jgi:hypothetical protein
MRSHELMAIATRVPDAPALEVRVNFGVFAGREATPAEIDELGAELLPYFGELSIVAENRHEIGEETEASLHQVRIEISGEQLPDDDVEVERLAGRLIERATRWAESCIAERKVEIPTEELGGDLFRRA